ncbi:T9SS type B sorting domain-containing protein [uncultured Maribacter sp.]|uniref:T9SS type B sorting domain-containing protein n=1 Tax=uncultured Maribacter sp. TaxID=431308 RepID=UPI002617079E|nr:T9SS type B sorting domain-containing protein [uncultured Maribacter sp.]
MAPNFIFFDFRVVYKNILPLILCFLCATNIFSQDTDGDTIFNNIDVDDDNDGILDINDCVVPIANYSFETPIPYSIPDNWIKTSGALEQAGTHDLDASNYATAPDGNQFLYINSGDGITNQVTLDLPYDVYSETGYIFTIAIGDGIGLTSYRNDGISTIEMGYGNDAASFTPIPGASIVVDGSLTPNGIWTDFQIPFIINPGNLAINEGILIRITHEGRLNELAGNYDNLRLDIDTDTDGISNCLEVDSDNDGCFDGEEAGHSVNGIGRLNNTGVNPDGSLTPASSGYTGNNQYVINNLINTCSSTHLDNDNDGILNNVDLDDDNDGITDVYECEIPVLNHSFEIDAPFSTTTGWTFISASGGGTHDLQIDNYNYTTEGTQFGFINDTGTATLTSPWATFSEGGYILSVAIGDGIDVINGFRNDGTSTIELGYDNGGGFISVASRTITAAETPNGIWTDFSLNSNITTASAAIGQGILVRISHTGNTALNQRTGNYDNIRLVKDTDSDGISDCLDTDSDGDSCSDVDEAGYTNSGSNTLQGTGINPDGTVSGNIDGYLGNREAVINSSIIQCNIIDTDTDTVENGDTWYYNGAGNLLFDQYDLDNDNDGISDIDEDCHLTTQGTDREAYNFELPENNFIYDPANGNNEPFSTGLGFNGVTGVLDFWTASAPSITGPHLVNSDQFINPATLLPYSPNYKTDGAGLIDDPISFESDTYAFINGNGVLTQNTSPITIQEGSYILTIAVGDALDYEDPFRNDGQSIIEMGYDNGSGFTVLNSLTIESYETPNGLWTDFTFSATATPLSIGEQLLTRITHNQNVALNQQSGNYDYIRINFDYDGDGIEDCNDTDSDNDGCNDVKEAGFTDDDDDGYLGNTSPPTVNSNGIVTSRVDGYTTPVNLNVRSAGTLTVTTALVNATVCENQNASFTIGAVGSGNLMYEWTVSTDGGVTYGPPLAETTNTLSFATVAADNNNLYRVEVWGDDYSCREQSIAQLTVNTAPTLTSITPTNTNICVGDTAEFVILGDADDIVTYSLDGGTTSTTVSLDALGSATISQLSTTTNTTINIVNVEDNLTNCTANSPLTSLITVNTAPILTITNTICAPDLLSYQVDFTLNIGTVTTSFGAVSGNSITGIPSGTNITITVDNNGCVRTFNVTAPNCNCPFIEAPTNPNNPNICFGEPNAILTVQLPTTGLGDQINWYSNSSGGTSIATGLSYTSTDTAIGTYTYYAETEETVSGCVSGTRTPVTFSITEIPIADTLPNIDICDTFTLPALSTNNSYYTGTNGTGVLLNAGDNISSSQTVYILAQSPTNSNCIDEKNFTVNVYETPHLTIDNVYCETNLLTYNVDFSFNTGVITTSTGTVSGNSIINIPIGTDISITSSNNICSDTVLVNSPTCECPTIDPPINPINLGICSGSLNKNLSVSLPATGLGDTVNWYANATGGLILSTGTIYSATDVNVGTYTYYAEAIQTISGCTSNRIPVTLTISEVATADTMVDINTCENYFLPNLSTNNHYYTGPNATGTQLNPGDLISNTQRIYIYAESPTNPNCNDESSFVVTIFNTPIINIPETLTICTDENGNTSSIPVGEYIGPNYTYNWTPDNDTNGDGIEEPIFLINQPGFYTLEITDINNNLICPSNVYSIRVTNTPIPLEIDVQISHQDNKLNVNNEVLVIVNTSNAIENGKFEYSIDNPNGPFQESNSFSDLLGGLHIAYARNSEGCGRTIESIPFLIINFPTVFTPNSDGFNDNWNIIGLDNINYSTNVTISIFDRYGKLLAQIDPYGLGWDGTFKGKHMPSTDYWFIVNYTDVNSNKKVNFNGHFSLIR